MPSALNSALPDSLTTALVDVTRRAGEAILEVYESDFEVRSKSDASPITEADLAAHEVITAALATLTPDIPLLSEESEPPPFRQRQRWQRYWLVDPLDGTREFVSRNGQFTVNIALIEHGRPRFGLVGVPVQGQVYLGCVASGRAECHENGRVRPIGGHPMAADRPLIVVASRSHRNRRLERYLAALAHRFPGVERRALGSSLKLCLLADGGADLYPRLGPTSEWDIAAAHAVLAAAGGSIRRLDGQPIAYNKRNFLNPEFIAVADASYPWADRLPDVNLL